MNPSVSLQAAALTPSASTSQGCAVLVLWALRLVVYGAALGAVLGGGPVTCAIAVLVALVAQIGEREGGIRHALRLLTLAGVAFGSPLLGEPLTRAAAYWLGLSLPIARFVGLVGAALVLLYIVDVVARRLSRAARRGRLSGALDRSSGLVIGTAEGLLLAAVICWALVTLQGLAPQQGPHAQKLAQTSDALQRDPLARALLVANPVEFLMTGERHSALAPAGISVGTVDAQQAAQQRLRTLVDEPVVRKHLEQMFADPQMRSALSEKDLFAIISSPHFVRMLGDADLQAKMMSGLPDVQRLLPESAAGAPASEIRRAGTIIIRPARRPGVHGE